MSAIAVAAADEAPSGLPSQSPQAEIAPLSFAQQGLWLLDAVTPGSPAYNIRRAVRIIGPLDIVALEASLNDIVQRHAALRTTFAVVGSEPMQVVARSLSLPLALEELTHLPSSERECAARSRLQAHGVRPFDLRTGPLLRAVLLRLGPNEHVLLLVFHHIVFDDAAIEPFNRELQGLYRHHHREAPLDLPELELQYPDFARAQTARTDGALADDFNYWRGQLADAPPGIDLPTDRPRPLIGRGAGAIHSRRIAREISARLRHHGERAGTTLFMTLLAAFEVLLYRWTGQRDIVVGAPVANRTSTELEPLIGFFVNTLVLRSKLSGELSFAEVLERVRETALDAYDHQEVPFTRLVAELRPERSSGASPLFNVMFFVRAALGEPLTLDGLQVGPFSLDSTTSKYDLSMRVAEEADGLHCTVQYDTELFDTRTIERLLTYYERVLTAVVDAPERPIARLPLLDEAERRRLIVDWNATDVLFESDRRVHEIVEAQVERTPDAVAVACDDVTLSYRELNARANRVARALRAGGVMAQEAVGICLEPSPAMIVTALGTLKAGAAYLPLDSTYPPERVRVMLADSGARIVLTCETTRGVVTESGADVMVLDVNAPEFADYCGDNLTTDGSAMDLAYVMYTSGSSGRPKGVLIPHLAISRLTTSSPNYIKLGSTDVVAQISNWAFDAATFELWGSLTSGARIEIIPRNVILSEEFGPALRRAGITVMFLTAALFRYVSRRDPTAFASLRCLLVGGEPVDAASAQAVLASEPPQRLLNAYGPTEATTFACTYEIARQPDAIVPIGRPIANTRVYILDADHNPVPVGCRGQLYIGGPGLALGYLNDDELTALAFIADPFISSERLYATGDLARYRDDGVIELLGRADRQVKIRGFRIELGEVEAALKRIDAVSDASAHVCEDETGDKRLVAFITESGHAAADGGYYRRLLARHLPRYLVPNDVIVVTELPLSMNGKLDVNALVQLGNAASDGDKAVADGPGLSGSAAIASILERQLIDIWQRTLGIAPVGTHDDFFALGGHSLLAVQMMEQVEHSCGERVPLAELFATPTIAHLAEVILDRARRSAQGPLIAVQPDGRRTPLFFLHGALGGDGFYCRALARDLGPDQPFFALTPHGVDGRPVPPTIEAMAQDYLAVVRSAQPQGPYRLGGFCAGGLVAFEMARQLSAAGEDVDRLILLDAVAFGARFAWLEKLLHCLAPIGLGLQQRQRILAAGSRRMRFISEAGRLGSVDALRSLRDELKPRCGLGALLSESGRTGISLDDQMRLISRAYVPRRYPGRMNLLVSGEASSSANGDTFLGWKRACDGIDLQRLPGGHLAAVSLHTEVVAGYLRAILEDDAEAQRSRHTREVTD